MRSQVQMGVSFVQCGTLNLAVWLHTVDDPPNELWSEALERVKKQKALVGVAQMRMLVVTDGGAPNSTQRGSLVSDVLEGQVKSAVVTTVLSNRLKRGIITALSWLNPNILGVPPHQYDQALAFLDVADYRGLVTQSLVALQQQLPPVESLKAILEAK